MRYSAIFPSIVSTSYVRKTVIWAYKVQHNFIGYVSGSAIYINFYLIVKHSI